MFLTYPFGIHGVVPLRDLYTQPPPTTVLPVDPGFWELPDATHFSSLIPGEITPSLLPPNKALMINILPEVLAGDGAPNVPSFLCHIAH